jgi:integrase
MQKIKLTKTVIEALPPATKSREVYQDSADRYLHVIVTKAGGKSYYCIRHFRGKPKYIKIAGCHELSLVEAKRICNAHVTDLVNGIDPTCKTDKDITLKRTIELYIDDRVVKKGETEDVRKTRNRIANNVPIRLLSRPVNEIAKNDIIKLHHAIKDKSGIVAANRTLAALRAAINLLIKRDYDIPKNPASHIEMFPEKSRSRFITQGEVQQFFDALRQSDSEDFKDFVQVALFTSKRRGNVQSMQWSEIDFTSKLWTISGDKTKNNEEDVTVLDDVVIDILNRRKKDQQAKGIKTDYVFYSPLSKDGYYKEPKTAWRNLLKRAKIDNLRMHDLRRTLASWMANNNVSLHMIANILGQKSTGATPVYARFATSPKREAVSKAIADILTAGKLKYDGELKEDEHLRNIQEIVSALTDDPDKTKQVLSYLKGL